MEKSLIPSETKKNINSHIYWARLLLDNILNGNGYTKYEHTNGPVLWGFYDNNSQYVSVTDCSGFINALLKKVYDLPTNWLGINRPYAITYYRAIDVQKNFIKIDNIYNTKIGDFIVFRILPGTSKSDNTGHIMLVNDMPKKIFSISPLITNTIQWKINIIDQSSYHGTDDTRYNDITTGLGSGFLRIYTDMTGNLQGYSWSMSVHSQYIDKNVHPLVIGRLNISDK